MSENIEKTVSTEETEKKEKKGIVQSTLKFVAIGTMFIDHFGASIVERYLNYNEVSVSMNKMMEMHDQFPSFFPLLMIYYVMRLIGRIAFPIFIFCLVDGYHHTSNVKKYILRLGIFALISEVPFDMALRKSYFDFAYQNVYFTMTLGMITIWALDSFTKKAPSVIGKKYDNPTTVNLLVGGGKFLIIMVMCVVAVLLKTDYNAVGVMAIAVAYLLWDKSMFLAHVGCCGVLTCCMPIEFTCFTALPLIAKYNGQRGFKHKYFFYLFYPLHLLILGLACLYLKI